MHRAALATCPRRFDGRRLSEIQDLDRLHADGGKLDELLAERFRVRLRLGEDFEGLFEDDVGPTARLSACHAHMVSDVGAHERKHGSVRLGSGAKRDIDHRGRRTPQLILSSALKRNVTERVKFARWRVRDTPVRASFVEQFRASRLTPSQRSEHPIVVTSEHNEFRVRLAHALFKHVAAFACGLNEKVRGSRMLHCVACFIFVK
jgi:hypothetical protein